MMVYVHFSHPSVKTSNLKTCHKTQFLPSQPPPPLPNHKTDLTQYTFTNYTSNPVLRASPPSTQFRDPKVLWYEDHWVMVIAYAQEFAIGIFTSPDLKTWTHASNFTNHGLLGLQYECPNLVSMPVRGEDSMWLMAISSECYFPSLHIYLFCLPRDISWVPISRFPLPISSLP